MPNLLTPNHAVNTDPSGGFALVAVAGHLTR
jgi:hypothetical protein